MAPEGDDASSVWNRAPEASERATVPSRAPLARMRSLDVHRRHVTGSACGSNFTRGAPPLRVSHSEISSSDAEASMGGGKDEDGVGGAGDCCAMFKYCCR